jgi:aspartate 1-decarboxylase
MMQTFLKSKIHRATVTDKKLTYEGSITIDAKLMREAGLSAYEKVQVLNVNTGERFETYTIPGKPRAGQICLNGPAARLGEIGDVVVIISYAQLRAEEIKTWRPVVVQVDEKNRMVKRKILSIS